MIKPLFQVHFLKSISKLLRLDEKEQCNNQIIIKQFILKIVA